MTINITFPISLNNGFKAKADYAISKDIKSLCPPCPLGNGSCVALPNLVPTLCVGMHTVVDRVMRDMDSHGDRGNQK